MFDTPLEIIGQIFGMIAVILGFICFQMKSSRGILIFQMIIALTFALHYTCIGEPAAAPVNILAAVQSLCYYFRSKKGSNGLFLPLFFTALMVGVNAFSWAYFGGDWYTVFLLLGVAAMVISLSFSSAQNIRYATLIKSPLCLTYNVFAGSIGGMVYEGAVLTSSIIGIIKYIRENKNGKI